MGKRYVDLESTIDTIVNYKLSCGFASKRIFDAIIDDIKRLPIKEEGAFDWVSVKEYCPSDTRRVQVQLDNSWIITAYYDNGVWIFIPPDINESKAIGEGYYDYVTVLAWRDLPDQYEEK